MAISFVTRCSKCVAGLLVASVKRSSMRPPSLEPTFAPNKPPPPAELRHRPPLWLHPRPLWPLPRLRLPTLLQVSKCSRPTRCRRSLFQPSARLSRNTIISSNISININSTKPLSVRPPRRSRCTPPPPSPPRLPPRYQRPRGCAFVERLQPYEPISLAAEHSFARRRPRPRRPT